MFKLCLSVVVFLLASSLVQGNTAKTWQNQLDIFGISGQTQTWNYQKDKLNTKGKSEALVFLPSQALPDSLTIIFWFHGCGGYSDRTFDIRLAKQLDRLNRQNHSYALVVPELLWSKNTKTTCGRQSKSFRNSGDLINFVNDSKKRINALFVATGKNPAINPRVVFVGHSAGGSVFKATALSGDLCKINPATVVWSDSTYGDWFKVAWRGCLKRGNSKTVVLIRKWTKTWKSFNRFMKNKSIPEFLEVKYYGGKVYHSTIGDNAIEFSNLFPEGC